MADDRERLTVISKAGEGEKERTVRMNSPMMPIRETPVYSVYSIYCILSYHTHHLQQCGKTGVGGVGI